MGSVDADLAAEFDQQRGRLIGVAYRLTGRLADAEDAVQEAWLRLSTMEDTARIRDLSAWLTTVVGRICLDRMRSAAARRERYVGPWLPEPIVTSPEEQDPARIVLDQEQLRVAALRVLHELSPDQRLAFVLHDGFEVPFGEIADILGCTVAAARQHASRGRRALAEGQPAPRPPLPEQQRVLDELLAAISAADIGAVVRVLHPDVTFYGDGNGRKTARRPVVGADNVSRFIVGLVRKYGPALYTGYRPVLVNGELGIFIPGVPEREVVPRVLTVAVQDGQVAAIYDIANPDKLTRLPW